MSRLLDQINTLGSEAIRRAYELGLADSAKVASKLREERDHFMCEHGALVEEISGLQNDLGDCERCLIASQDSNDLLQTNLADAEEMRDQFSFELGSLESEMDSMQD